MAIAVVEAPGLAGLAGVLERLTVIVRRLPAPGALSLTTAATLNTLMREGPARLTDLARGQAVTQPAMTQLVSRLERDGLARRAADPVDGRVVIVSITPSGTALLTDRRAARVTQVAALVGQCGSAERAALAAAMPALERLALLGEQAHDASRAGVGR